MTPCNGLTCCISWSNLSRWYNSGMHLEAALEAARRVRTGDDDAPGCRYRNRCLAQMQEEGWLDTNLAAVQV